MKAKTNHEAWHGMRRYTKQGMTAGEASAKLGISAQMGRVYLRQDKPASRVRKLNSHMRVKACGSCKNVAIRFEADMCRECASRHYSDARKSEVDRMREYCEKLGEIPPVRKAAQDLGISRSKASELLIEIYGKRTILQGRKNEMIVDKRKHMPQEQKDRLVWYAIYNPEKTLQEIADMHSVSMFSVSKWMRERGVARRAPELNKSLQQERQDFFARMREYDQPSIDRQPSHARTKSVGYFVSASIVAGIVGLLVQRGMS